MSASGVSARGVELKGKDAAAAKPASSAPHKRLAHGDSHHKERHHKERHHKERLHGHQHGPDPIFISTSSRCCGRSGPRDRHCRLELFEFVEARWFQYLMLALLVVDVLIVGLEICVTYRLIKPAPDLDQQSLGIPRDMVCADSREVEYRYGYPIEESEPGTLEDCCHDFAAEYPVTDMWDTGYVGDDVHSVNVAACMLATNWTGPEGPRAGTTSELLIANSTSGSHRRSLYSLGTPGSHRMLLSASSSSSSSGTTSSAASSGHGPPPPRCYDYPNHKYRPPAAHYPIQDLMHWISNSILFVFLVELLVILYAMRPAQFFCACRYTVREDDLVRVVDRDTGVVKCEHAIVTHVNLHTGKACVRPVKYQDIDLSKGQVNELAKKRTRIAMRKLTMTRASWKSGAKGTGSTAEAEQTRKLSAVDEDYSEEGRGASGKAPAPSSVADRPAAVTTDGGDEDDDAIISLSVSRGSNPLAGAMKIGETTLKDVPYWELEHFGASHAQSAAPTWYNGFFRRNKGCESPCTWFNRFFVLDLIVVVAAIVLENMTQILESIQRRSGAISDTTAITEAGVFLIIVRCWRILRVFHGAWEARNKAEANVMDVEEEIRTVVDFSLYSLVRALHEVEHGDMKPEDFVKSFRRVFGNDKDPKAVSAERGVGRNYIGPIERDILKTGGKCLHGSSRNSGLF